MGHSRDEATEAMLGHIIAQGSDEVASFLNDTDGQLEGLVKKRAMFMMASAH